jgi:2-dehydro-3-deoxy-D-arabinonate dehydratase
VLDITSPAEGIRSTLDLIEQGKTAAGLTVRAAWLARRARGRPLDWAGLQGAASRRVPRLAPPLEPPEVWGMDGTYGPGGIAPPALFFKATGARCAGPGGALVVPAGAGRIVPEAELAVVVGADGRPLAFTACNDLTDADALRGGPAALGAAKVLRGGCALGPCLVTPDEIGDPDRLQIRCAVSRNGAEIFAATANTAQISSGVTGLVARLAGAGRVPPGTILATGSGIALPESLQLADGDVVDIEVEGIGRLRNPIKALPPDAFAAPPEQAGPA